MHRVWYYPQFQASPGDLGEPAHKGGTTVQETNTTNSPLRAFNAHVHKPLVELGEVLRLDHQQACGQGDFL